MPTESTRERSAFYHALNRSMTRANQESYNTTLDSAGVDASVAGLYKSLLPFVATKAEVDTFLTSADPVPVTKANRVTLTPLAGSNNQTYYITVGGQRAKPFITEQFLLDLSTNAVPNAYVLELYQQDGTRIPPTTGDWWVKPDEGLIRFEEGSTPVDKGWGNITATVYVGTLNSGSWRFYDTEHTFVIQHYNDVVGEWDDHIRIEHNEVHIKGTLVADLNSFQLGEAHTISSGGEQVVFRNRDMGWITTPVGSAVNYQETTGLHTIFNDVSVKQFGEEYLFQVSDPATTGAVEAEYFTTNNLSVGFFGVEFVAAETYKGTIVFKLAYGKDDVATSGIYEEVLEIDVVEGQAITLVLSGVGSKLGVNTPNQKYDQSYIKVSKEDRTNLLVRPRQTDGVKPWVRIRVRNITYKFAALSDTPGIDVTDLKVSGETEFAEREEAAAQTLHDTLGFGLADKDGHYLTFKGPSHSEESPYDATIEYIEDRPGVSGDFELSNTFVHPVTGERQIDSLILSGTSIGLADKDGLLLDFRNPIASGVTALVASSENLNFVTGTEGNLVGGLIHFAQAYNSGSLAHLTAVLTNQAVDDKITVSATTQSLSITGFETPSLVVANLIEGVTYNYTATLFDVASGESVVTTGSQVASAYPAPQYDVAKFVAVSDEQTQWGSYSSVEDGRMGYFRIADGFLDGRLSHMELTLNHSVTSEQRFYRTSFNTAGGWATSEITISDLPHEEDWTWSATLTDPATGQSLYREGALVTSRIGDADDMPTTSGARFNGIWAGDFRVGASSNTPETLAGQYPGMLSVRSHLFRDQPHSTEFWYKRKGDEGAGQYIRTTPNEFAEYQTLVIRDLEEGAEYDWTLKCTTSKGGIARIRTGTTTTYSSSFDYKDHPGGNVQSISLGRSESSVVYTQRTWNALDPGFVSTANLAITINNQKRITIIFQGGVQNPNGDYFADNDNATHSIFINDPLGGDSITITVANPVQPYVIEFYRHHYNGWIILPVKGSINSVNSPILQ